MAIFNTLLRWETLLTFFFNYQSSHITIFPLRVGHSIHSITCEEGRAGWLVLFVIIIFLLVILILVVLKAYI